MFPTVFCFQDFVTGKYLIFIIKSIARLPGQISILAANEKVSSIIYNLVQIEWIDESNFNISPFENLRGHPSTGEIADPKDESHNCIYIPKRRVENKQPDEFGYRG